MGIDDGRNLYEVLGVPVDASTSAIRKAFHKLALRLHPDKLVGSEAEGVGTENSASFLLIKDAADRLLDSYQRSLYDAHLGLSLVRDVGAVSDTFDLWEDFTLSLPNEADAKNAEHVSNPSGSLSIYYMECRCGGMYEVISLEGARENRTAVENVEPHTQTISTFEYNGKKRVRHVVECDCCSLVIAVAGKDVDQHSEVIPLIE